MFIDFCLIHIVVIWMNTCFFNLIVVLCKNNLLKF